ncbi:MAG: NAD(P)-dependent oxidoreductase [Chloroflexi bacterium]|nr:NAD(P)-dependent oxidoreductase [Chloroflexota bacterium]
MNILITGGAGYIGSVLVPMLLARGHGVTVLDSFMFKSNSLMDCCIYENFRVVRGDCRDESTLRSALKDADVIIPLAALVGAPLCDRDKVGAETINRGAVELLCRIASKEQRIMIPNTNSGYGIGEHGKFCTEDSPLRPISLYGVTKSQAEQAVLERGNSLSFRLATVFGTSPRMRLDLLVNDFVYRAVVDRALVIFEGHFKRNFVHIRDVAAAFEFALENFERMAGKPYNLGLDSANLSKLELCAEIKKQLPQFTYIEAPIGEDPDKRDYIVSNARLLATGFTPQHSLQSGIAELIKAYTIIRGGAFGNV